MTAAFERSAVGSILNSTTWTATQIAWPNRDFSPPDDASYLAVFIRSGDAFQKEIGSPQVIHRHPGVVIVQVFVPTNTGDLAARTFADQVAALFRRQRVDTTDGSIVFRTPTIREIGPEKAHYQFNVSIPFVRDHLF